MGKSEGCGGPTEFEKALAEYRGHLLAAEQKMQADYDKSVLILSGGAIGLSMTFVKDLLGNTSIGTTWLLWAWIFWGLSIVANFISFYTSSKALRSAIQQVDLQEIYIKAAKSPWATATAWCNIMAGTGFVLGMVMIIVFVGKNLK